MQDFKRLIRKAILFVMILALLLGALSHLAEKLAVKNEELVPPRIKSLVKIHQEEPNTIDVLILGDSLSYSSFSPMQLWNRYGMTAFVGGQSGQTIQESYYMLKAAWKKQNPRVVVLETNCIFRSAGGLDAAGEVIRTTAGYYFPVFTFHDMWKAIALGKRYPEENYKGFQFRENRSPYKGGSYLSPSDEEENISAVTRIYLRKIRALCEAHGAKLIFVSAPSPDNYSSRTHNALQVYTEGTGLVFWDLNFMLKELGIDWSRDSLDGGDHLNFSGAQKVTDWLGRQLQKCFPLPDHRGDTRYRQWEILDGIYEQRAGQTLDNMNKNQS